jgi:hypothetical protein
MIEVNQDLKDLIDGKNVCVVGPSSYLIEEDLGNYINSFDIICRVNDLIPFNYEDKYGDRTDVIFNALHPEAINEFRQCIMRGYGVYKDVKLNVITWRPESDHGKHWKGTIEELYDAYFKGFEEKKRYFISNEYHESLLNRLQRHMNCGIASLSILNNYNFNSLFITGFTFYHEFNRIGNDFDSCYFPGRNPEFKLKYTKGGITFNPLISHDQNIQKEYFVKEILLRNEKRIIIDSYLRDILGLVNYRNVYQLKNH